MFCKHCGAPVPENAWKCNNCFKTPGIPVRGFSLPHSDMYRQPIYEVKADVNKRKNRVEYLKRLPEYCQQKNAMKEATGGILKYVLLMFASIFGMMIFGSLVILISMVKSSILVPLFGAVFIGFLILAIFCGINMTRANKPKIINLRNSEIHNNKSKYYANNTIFGYSVRYYSASSGRYKHEKSYLFYEVDKRNIKGISYNPYFAEYILHLHKPVYINYDLEPSYEFRIPDVFDDTVLTNALGIKLPPKK